jgi:hypothetical protein
MKLRNGNNKTINSNGRRERLMKSIFKERLEFFCVDCQAHTQQNLKGLMPDNTVLYQCERCGCENSIDIEEAKKEEQNI